MKSARRLPISGSLPTLLLLALPCAAGPAPASLPPMKTYRTALGLSLRHPAAWQVSEGQGAVVLLPDDAARDSAGQPLHLFLAGVFPLAAAGVTEARDPRLAAQMDQEIAGSFPGLARTGTAGAYQSGRGAGAIHAFEGSVAGGPHILLRAYLQVQDGQGLFLLYLARKDLAGRYEDVALRMAQSLDLASGGGLGKGGDPALVRAWSWSRTGGSSGLYAEDTTTWTFHADGQVERARSSTISGGTADASVYAGPARNVERGTYTAAGGSLTVVWSHGGVEQYGYLLFEHDGAPALKLQPPSGKPRYYR